MKTSFRAKMLWKLGWKIEAIRKTFKKTAA